MTANYKTKRANQTSEIYVCIYIYIQHEKDPKCTQILATIFANTTDGRPNITRFFTPIDCNM